MMHHDPWIMPRITNNELAMFSQSGPGSGLALSVWVLRLHGGAQLAVDTTLVSALRRSQTWSGASRRSAIGGASAEPSPSLCALKPSHSLWCQQKEVVGLLEETVTFLRLLAAARAWSESALLGNFEQVRLYPLMTF